MSARDATHTQLYVNKATGRYQVGPGVAPALATASQLRGQLHEVTVQRDRLQAELNRRQMDARSAPAGAVPDRLLPHLSPAALAVLRKADLISVAQVAAWVEHARAAGRPANGSVW